MGLLRVNLVGALVVAVVCSCCLQPIESRTTVSSSSGASGNESTAAAATADMSTIVVEKVADSVELGEGPHWDVKKQKLYYVDIDGRKILRFDPLTKRVTYAHVKHGHVGVAIPVEGSDDEFVAASGTDLVLVTWNGEENADEPPMKKIASLDTDRSDTRINDGKCDAYGRFWLGTMAHDVGGQIAPNRGSLYRIGPDLKPESVISPVTISNGLTWSLDDNVMYYIDSPTHQVWAFDYNVSTGDVHNKRVVFDLKKNNIKGIPDGMTIDVQGNLWVALFDGAAVIQVNPKTGKLLQKVQLPVDKITSVAFGGPNLDILYVTSARVNMSDEEKSRKPDAGSLFAIKGLGVTGLPPYNFKYSDK
ncbi:hypothetical protein TKK_0011121 [Trichogramma kaykai]|uniref:Regucalcin n=1 Tax=Trichogramma kaykai TaxID=54128 RepID=A0ABD2WV68_9HYME